MHIFRGLSEKELYLGYCTLSSMCIASIFVHEYSHLKAMRALFTNINPYLGCDFSPPTCYASYNGTPIIRPELSITYKTARGIEAAAGPIADLLGVVISSIISWKIRESNKKISLLFATHAFIMAANTFGNAMQSQIFGITGNGDYSKVELLLGIPISIQTTITGLVTLSATAMLAKLNQK